MAAEGRSVVIADDHPVYREVLSHAVRAEAGLRLVGAAADGREALEIVEREVPDVAVLDVEMPHLSGPVVAGRIAQLELPTRVLFLSAHDDGATVYDALAAGGYGFITKDAPLGEIRQAILRVAEGVRRLGAGVEHQVIEEIQIRSDPQTLELTEGELAVLDLSVQGLTAAAMGRRLNLSGATVEVRVARLYAKLGVSDRAGAVAEAIRRGLVG